MDESRVVGKKDCKYSSCMRKVEGDVGDSVKVRVWVGERGAKDALHPFFRGDIGSHHQQN